MTTYTARAITPVVLKELRSADDGGRRMVPGTDTEGGAPLRCCLRRSEPGEHIALVSYAPLRRWAAETGNGATWTPPGPVPATTSGSRGTALLTHPARSTGSGWVSLRTSGEDTAGNTFSQTVFRVYRYLG
jgi:hypothetical protein